MNIHSAETDLVFPFPEAPATGTVTEVAPGILWTRIPLPFRLDHVNVFLLEDGDGWAVVDTGIGDDATREVWYALVNGPLAGRRLTRLIVTHFHPDHIGLAGWLCATFDMKMLTSQTAWLGCLNISLSPGALDAKPYRDFYALHGLSAETVRLVTTQGHGYLRMVTPLPPTFSRLVAGDRLAIGDRVFDVMSGNGHAPEQIMLYSAADRIFLGADQVLAKITPNISVWPVEPEGDPLGLYLRSLDEIARTIPADALVLPGHQLPFYGLRRRCAELAAHHEQRCDRLIEACRVKPSTVGELVPVLFPRKLDPHQLSFAFSETFAHVNALVRRGRFVWEERRDGVQRVRPV